MLCLLVLCCDFSDALLGHVYIDVDPPILDSLVHYLSLHRCPTDLVGECNEGSSANAQKYHRIIGVTF